jgi:hypothetical protein
MRRGKLLPGRGVVGIWRYIECEEGEERRVELLSGTKIIQYNSHHEYSSNSNAVARVSAILLIYTWVNGLASASCLERSTYKLPLVTKHHQKVFGLPRGFPKEPPHKILRSVFTQCWISTCRFPILMNANYIHSERCFT